MDLRKARLGVALNDVVATAASTSTANLVTVRLVDGHVAVTDSDLSSFCCDSPLFVHTRCLLGVIMSTGIGSTDPQPGSLHWKLSSHPISLLFFLGFRIGRSYFNRLRYCVCVKGIQLTLCFFNSELIHLHLRTLLHRQLVRTGFGTTTFISSLSTIF